MRRCAASHHDRTVVGGTPTEAPTFSYPDARVVADSRAFSGAATYASPRAFKSVDGRDDRGRLRRLGLLSSARREAVRGSVVRRATRRSRAPRFPSRSSSYDYWQRELGGVPLTSGLTTIKLSDRTYQVIGVTPPRFQRVGSRSGRRLASVRRRGAGRAVINGVVDSVVSHEHVRAHARGRTRARRRERRRVAAQAQRRSPRRPRRRDSAAIGVIFVRSFRRAMSREATTRADSSADWPASRSSCCSSHVRTPRICCSRARCAGVAKSRCDSRSAAAGRESCDCSSSRVWSSASCGGVGGGARRILDRRRAAPAALSRRALDDRGVRRPRAHRSRSISHSSPGWSPDSLRRCSSRIRIS